MLSGIDTIDRQFRIPLKTKQCSDITEVLGGGSVYFGVGRHVGKRALGLEEIM
jgi:hypothetical protein